MITRYPDIRLRKYQGGKADWWEVTDRVRVVCKLHRYGRFIIEVGFISDFASALQLLWWLIPPHGRTAMACIVHDYLYEKNPVNATRREVDRFWLELLKKSGVPKWQVWLMYYYVRALGWYNWKKYRDGEQN